MCVRWRRVRPLQLRLVVCWRHSSATNRQWRPSTPMTLAVTSTALYSSQQQQQQASSYWQRAVTSVIERGSSLIGRAAGRARQVRATGQSLQHRAFLSLFDAAFLGRRLPAIVANTRACMSVAFIRTIINQQQTKLEPVNSGVGTQAPCDILLKVRRI